ncbi:MAG: Hsp20/alpha crystallin family protein [Clostridia bacterium]
MFDLVPKRKTQYDVFDMMDDLLKTSFYTPGTYATGMKTDIRETDNEYVLEAEIPGFAKEDINLELKNNYLIISAEKEESGKEETEAYIRRERKFGSVARSFYVEGVKEEDIKASYNNGILEIRLPKEKKQVQSGRKLPIE